MNLAVTIVPAIGGILAGINYLLLFIIDCVVSIITAIIVYFALPETKPETPEGKKDRKHRKERKRRVFYSLLAGTARFSEINYSLLSSS
jgi:uncharacterized membrane protein